MVIQLPDDVAKLLHRLAQERNLSPEQFLRDVLAQQMSDNPLLRSSQSVDEIEPAIPTSDLSEHFNAYLRESWGEASSGKSDE
ncbi:MAG: hypothetical protein RLP44_20215 [Aggregatilineales bacterium]